MEEEEETVILNRLIVSDAPLKHTPDPSLGLIPLPFPPPHQPPIVTSACAGKCALDDGGGCPGALAGEYCISKQLAVIEIDPFSIRMEFAVQTRRGAFQIVAGMH